MRTSLSLAALLAAGAVFAGWVVGCGGAFAGPPQGSGLPGGGRDPVMGATPFTFYPEMPMVTGFANDHWFLHPGLEIQDTGIKYIGYGIDALQKAGFEAFVNKAGVGTPIASPSELEVNVMEPAMLSFIAQWFLRRADGSRPKEKDAFGKAGWSASCHDISLITAPMGVDLRVDTGLYPAGGNLPLFGFTSPPPTDPAGFPKPSQPFTGSQYNQLGIAVYSLIAAPGTSAISPMGGAVADDENNSHVENIGSSPVYVNGVLSAPVNQPTGVFADIFAMSYNSAPVEKPSDPDVYTPVSQQSIDDPDLEEALIEFCRHFAAVHTNLIGQAIGLAPIMDGSLMDPAMVQLENRYEYRFNQDNHRSMSTKIVGDPDPTDERVNVGQLPGAGRRSNKRP